jgi:hydrogenase-4 component F
MVEIVFLVPFFASLLAFLLPSRRGRQLLVLTGLLHLSLVVSLWLRRPEATFPLAFRVTPEGLLSLIVISLLFFLISIYTGAYLHKTKLQSEHLFCGCMLLFLSTMTMVALADHIMVIWMAIEATTLASAPLIFSHRTAASLEATWKYVIICSVGISLALVGSVLITVSMDVGKVDAPMSFSSLTEVAARLDPMWLKVGFVFILVGYGTKMGLAPMHTWLPDAHSEAPGPASALLSGVLLNCAYLGILRTHKIMQAAGLGDFSGHILVVFGLVSMLAAATFILRQDEYKRLLAYSSIENMGIIAFGTGIGGVGAFGAVLCLIHHSLIKSSLFLTSGNILLGYGSRWIAQTGKLTTRMPKTALAFLGGFVGIAGFPPFGLFLGEVLIIVAAFRAGHHLAIGIFLASLCIIFAGFANQVMKISYADSPGEGNMDEPATMVWPQYALLLTSVVLCCWMPATLHQAISQAAGFDWKGFLW